MKRGRNKKPKGRDGTHTTQGGGGTTSNAEFRKSSSPIVVVCHSRWMKNTDTFCSKTNQWQVVVYTPDTEKWWDRLQKNCRIRNGPPTRSHSSCHAIVVYDKFPYNNNNNNNNHDQEFVLLQNAIKLLGDNTNIITVTLLNGPNEAMNELETAMSSSDCIKTVNMDLLLTSYMELRQLWLHQDTHENEIDDHQSPTKQHQVLQINQVPELCNDWSNLKWRWNGPRLRDLYQRLRRCKDGKEDDDEKQQEPPSFAIDGNSHNNDEMQHNNTSRMDEMDFYYEGLRLDFEEKAGLLLQDPDTQRVADYILTATQEDENLFGRIHAWTIFSSSQEMVEKRYLVVSPPKKQPQESKQPSILNAYDYATSISCTALMEQLKMVSEYPKDQFCIPIVQNAMATIRLIPSLYPTGITTTQSHQFDVVLGSRRIWEEHMALKASIIFLFQGQPGFLWDLAMRVVKNALPRTWHLLLREPPEETFLRSLLHPDVIEAGRLLLRPTIGRNVDNKNISANNNDDVDGSSSIVIPRRYRVMSRIYALARFIQTLEKPNEIFDDAVVSRSVASTIKLDVEQVSAVVAMVSTGTQFNSVSCGEIFNMKQEVQDKKGTTSSDVMTPQAMEILGMLGLFLNRDRKSLRDAGRIEVSLNGSPLDVGPTYHTTKALADCAMYCGEIRWLSEEEEEYDGIWTCLPCLHRWQKRGEGEAYQTRKLMHPMTLCPFKREEYYDPEDWDRIMEATNGNIARLGVDFYWDKCSENNCRRVGPAVTRTGACAETDGVPIDDFPETAAINEGYETIQLRSSLGDLGPLVGNNNMVSADCLEVYFDSEEKLGYLPPPLRRRVRNCIDKSTYILPPGYLCDRCAVPDSAVEDFCPYCGTSFEPVFACVHFSCPQCNKHFCKACLGIDGIHFNGVYNARNHACWRMLGNRYSYHNKGLCAGCNKERPWPKSHALVSAGPAIRRRAADTGGKGLAIQEAIEMQASNLKVFTERYKDGAEIFLNCSHLVGLGPDFCHCGSDVDPNGRGDYNA